MLAYHDLGIPRGRLSLVFAKWVLAAREQAFCQRFAMANRLYWRMPVAVSYDQEVGLYVVEDAANGATTRPHRIVVGRPERIFRYRRGVAKRVHKLAAKYFIDRIPLADGDVVVDCGANVGEVGLHVLSRAKTRLVAIEPSELEARACDHNLFDGDQSTHRLALWNAAGEKTFYDSNVTGDSSLISPASPHAGVTTVATARLDDLAAKLEIQAIKLLKLEAEGAEPEILQGSHETIAKVSHCVVDCGPERGSDNQHVIPDVSNALFDAGFELVDVNLERQIHWFRNRRLT